MYDLHGTEDEFQTQFNPNNIDPNEIFRMFFQQAGGDPFANLFNGGGSSFTVYTTNFGNGGRTTRAHTNGGTRRQQRDPFGNGSGINIFDLLNGNTGGQGARRRHTRETEEYEEEIDPLNYFQQQRYQRGRNNRAARQNQDPNLVQVNLFNN
mmetsp:Transcript_35579/g.35212  ORF Transcript_35579/g.35212 Transcript_35579/m.35212 type:complete len:152 (+) Transcript_35579:155-610(+)